MLVRQTPSRLARAYQHARKLSPHLVKQRLPDLSARWRWHYAAVDMVYELGPVAARPLAGALCTVLDDPDGYMSSLALRSLRWSVPESAQATKALSKWLQCARALLKIAPEELPPVR